MHIGEKIRQRRVTYGLTQEELAVRTELSKGFISQVERDITSPSIATLMDILEALGTNISDFFNDKPQEKIVFSESDVSIKEYEDGLSVAWLIPNAQKNAMEPILIKLQPGAQTHAQAPHEGEEFAHVLTGSVQLVLGRASYRVKKDESCYYIPSAEHYIKNESKRIAKVLWVSTPPSF